MKAKIIKKYELLSGVFINPGEADVLPELYDILLREGYLENSVKLKIKKNGTNIRNNKRN